MRYERLLAAMDAAGLPVPEILYLFNVPPEAARHFSQLMNVVMRGRSDIARPCVRRSPRTQQSAAMLFMLLAAHGATAGKITGDARLIADTLDHHETAPISGVR